MIIKAISDGASLGSKLGKAIATVTNPFTPFCGDCFSAIGTLAGAGAGLIITAIVAVPSIAAVKSATTLAKAITDLAHTV